MFIPLGSGIIVGLIWQIVDRRNGSPCNSVHLEPNPIGEEEQKIVAPQGTD